VAGGRASGSGLETIGEPHALFSQSVHVGGDGLASIAAYIEVAQIICEYEDEIGLILRGKQACEDLRNKEKGECGPHGIDLGNENGDGKR